jgi:hypothetical protein
MSIINHIDNSLNILNATARAFKTKFPVGGDSLPLTPDHEKASKRKLPVASGRASRFFLKTLFFLPVICLMAYCLFLLGDPVVYFSGFSDFLKTLIRVLRASSRRYSPKLRGEDIIPQNAEGFLVYFAIYCVIWLSIEYAFYRLEMADKEKSATEKANSVLENDIPSDNPYNE